MPEIEIRNVTVDFPYEPYDIQKDYMEKVIECLQNVSIFQLLFHLYIVLSNYSDSYSVEYIRKRMAFWNHQLEQVKPWVYCVLLWHGCVLPELLLKLVPSAKESKMINYFLHWKIICINNQELRRIRGVSFLNYFLRSFSCPLHINICRWSDPPFSQGCVFIENTFSA